MFSLQRPLWLARLAVLGALSATLATLVVAAQPARATSSTVVGTAATSDGTGWWTVGGDGAVSANGSASYFGGMAGTHLNRPIVGIAATADGRGYWLVASDGGIFSFGDATFFGSTGALRLNRPIVGMSATPDGGGYWLVASDGGIFSFGDARFFGSTGNLHLNQPVVGMTASPDGAGYWLVASDGGIFTFGDARFYGSTGGEHLAAPIVGMASTTDRAGYWLVTSAGTVYAFGDATFAGSVAGTATFGVIGTSGGGYTVLSSDGPHHFGAPIAAALLAPPVTAPPVTAPPVTSAPVPVGAAAVAAAPSPSIVVSHAHLALKTGTTVQPYDFTGINAYQLASNWSVNTGCGWGGWDSGTLASFFSQMQPGSIVRTWAFQYLTTNRYTGARDWSALDQVVAAADRYDVHLVLTIGNQDGTCDDYHWKDPAWYASGYAQVYNSTGSTPESYAGYVHDLVRRYAGNPAIAMWEPINEPQAAACSVESGSGPGCWGNLSCPDEAGTNATLIHFFDTVGAEIHQLDPGKLVSDGSLGGQQCGVATPADWQGVIASSGIDVVGYHDYSGTDAQPPDMAGRVAAATSLGKPTMIGEAGIWGCGTGAQQAQLFQAKMTAAWDLGVSAYVPWRFENDNGNPQCDDLIDFGSPTMDAIFTNAHPVG